MASGGQLDRPDVFLRPARLTTAELDGNDITGRAVPLDGCPARRTWDCPVCGSHGSYPCRCAVMGKPGREATDAREATR